MSLDEERMWLIADTILDAVNHIDDDSETRWSPFNGLEGLRLDLRVDAEGNALADVTEILMGGVLACIALTQGFDRAELMLSARLELDRLTTREP